jgi:hypothetical protein
MNERGSYRPLVGQAPDPTSNATPWWKLAIGAAVVLGVGYLVMSPKSKGRHRSAAKGKEHESEIGPERGLSQTELMRVRAGARY